MGGSKYSDSDSDRSHSRKRKKHKTRRSRSHSGSRKSRKYKRSRSRERSRERRRRRSRSRDRRRTPSRDRRSYSRSSSRERRYRSRSPNSHRDFYRDGRNSWSSRDYGSKYTSRSRSKSPPTAKSFADMTPAELNKARLQLAIEKAQAADEAIRQRHGVSDADFADTKHRRDAIMHIEDEEFTQNTFKSSRSATATKEEAISKFDFGTSLDMKKSNASSTVEHNDELFAPVLFEDVEVKKRRWYERLCQLQQELLKT